jgi:phosphoglycolate phosphatase
VTSPLAAGTDPDGAERQEPDIDFSRIRLVLCDLDGTLVDSVPDLAWSANAMLRELGLPEHDPQAARAWVGNGVERFVKRALTGDMDADPEAGLFASGLELFESYYAAHLSRHSRVYSGVEEFLRSISAIGRHIACVTNKPEPFTSRLIAALGLDPFFDLVVAGNTTARRKPDPMPLQYAADYFSLDGGECLMVGDSRNDVVAARAAGFAVACVPYGYNHGADIRDADPDLVVDDLRQLAELFS